MAKRNLNVMRNVFANNTFKFAANVMMAMLFITLISACSGEKIGDHHPSSASNLLGSMTEANGIGWATVDVEANATDINNNNLSANADVRYACEKEVFVDSEEELGLPVVLTLTSENTIATGDKNVITRTENHGASKGVTLNVAGPDLSKGGTLGERFENGDTIRQAILANLIDEAFATTSALPEGKIKEWRGSKTSVVKYYRVFVKAAAPVEPIYRLRGEYVETVKGYSYYNVFAEKSLDNGNTWTKMDEYLDFVGERHGTWRPNVTAQLVSSYEFTTEDTTKEYDPEEDRPNLGNSKRWTVKNLSKIEYFWKAIFASPADAEGNTTRDIAGTQVQWLNAAVWSNPETGEDMTLNFTGGITTTHSVDESTGIYTRVNSVLCNGEVVESQPGTVTLIKE